MVVNDIFLKQFQVICVYDGDTRIQNSVTEKASNKCRRSKSFLRLNNLCCHSSSIFSETGNRFLTSDQSSRSNPEGGI